MILRIFTVENTERKSLQHENRWGKGKGGGGGGGGGGPVVITFNVHAWL